MTLSDPQINELINENFIVTWFNQAPDVFPPGTSAVQPPVDEAYLANFPDGAGGANVKFFFCTPGGEIVHFVQGFYKAASFRREVAFAQEALRVVERGGRGQQLRVAALHEARVASLRSEAAAPRAAGGGREERLRNRLLQVLIANHQIACSRLLKDPEPFMVNECLGIV